MPQFNQLAVDSLDQFIYGRAPKPLHLPGGVVIGGGEVHPELNFTLPEMEITEATLDQVHTHYQQMISEACQRAVDLKSSTLVVEYELLPPQTMNPQWGADVVAILRQTMDEYAKEHGLKGALRITPNDIRDHERPPKMRSGYLWDNMVKSFELCRDAGADMLSIESTGGKEVHDDAILNADLPQAAYALGVLAARDMAFLWNTIVKTCQGSSCVPAGDTACGFGNTAMVLAENKYIPKVWAAVIRVMTVARSLVAYEQGAIGPSKDCAYEGPYIKAITGFPISMEGAQAACAHLSQVGNISAAVADLWSNESVQNVKLLGGMAPTVSVEQLVYATRMMNVAASHNAAKQYQSWLVESDSHFDPQAFVLRPDVVLDVSQQIIKEPTPYGKVRIGAFAACEAIRKGHEAGLLDISERDLTWLDMLSSQAEMLPEDPAELEAQIVPVLDREKVLLKEYPA